MPLKKCRFIRKVTLPFALSVGIHSAIIGTLLYVTMTDAVKLPKQEQQVMSVTMVNPADFAPPPKPQVQPPPEPEPEPEVKPEPPPPPEAVPLPEPKPKPKPVKKPVEKPKPKAKPVEKPVERQNLFVFVLRTHPAPLLPIPVPDRRHPCQRPALPAPFP